MLRFYLDENLPIEIARQLRARDIEVVTVRDLDRLGDADIHHLQRATKMGYVLCTFDSDFLNLALSGTEHAGIVFGQQSQHYIGTWVRHLELMAAVFTADEMINRIEYL